MKYFSDDGSQEKLCFYRSSVKHRNTGFNGMFNFFDYFVNVHSFQEVNMHWQMAILSVPSYNLGRTFMLKKIKKKSATAWLQKKGTLQLLPQRWNWPVFQLATWFGRGSNNLESFHGADFWKHTFSFLTNFMQGLNHWHWVS